MTAYTVSTASEFLCGLARRTTIKGADDKALRDIAPMLEKQERVNQALIKIILDGSPFMDLDSTKRLHLAVALDLDCTVCGDGYFDGDEYDPNECPVCRAYTEESDADGRREDGVTR